MWLRNYLGYWVVQVGFYTASLRSLGYFCSRWVLFSQWKAVSASKFAKFTVNRTQSVSGNKPELVVRAMGGQ